MFVQKVKCNKEELPKITSMPEDNTMLKVYYIHVCVCFGEVSFCRMLAKLLTSYKGGSCISWSALVVLYYAKLHHAPNNNQAQCA